MIRALCFLLLVLPLPVWAVPVAVTSGEHDGFTRVVLNFGAPVDWQFGRTADGYEFRKSGEKAEYDLSGVFDLIGKSRLAAIAPNPATSNLEIGFACACHAIPFEFRPGIIVIDLRDGPPPKGSSFEDPLPELVPEIPKPEPVAPKDRLMVELGSYNWANNIIKNLQSPNMANLVPEPNLIPPPSSDPSLQPLRDQLLRQLSRGAADGVIDLELPRDEHTKTKTKGIDSARVKLGEMPGLRFERNTLPSPPLGEQGAGCIPEGDLDIYDWGADAPIADQFSATYTGLLGEFDRPDPEAVIKSVQFLLYIGFGIEADQMISAFIPDNPKAALLRSMARIMDGEIQGDSAFEGQLSCDTPAALWALLSKDKLGQGQKINEKAVILGFSTLPIHLRQLLGPPVIARFLENGDVTSAETIRAAIRRAGASQTAALSMADAKIQMAKGDPVGAQKQIETAIEQPGASKVDALIDLVETLVAQQMPIKVEIGDQLETFQREMKDTETAPLIARALSLARASAGQFAAAFEEAKSDPATTRQVWAILAALGTNDDILNFAVVPMENLPTDLDLISVNQLAQRLDAIGLPDAALSWINAYPAVDANIRAKVHLERRDGRAALLAATEVTGAQSAILQAQALQLLGNHLAAAQEFSKLGAAPEAERAFAKAGEWDRLQQGAANPWSPVINAITPSAAPAQTPITGPLSAGQNLLTQSADTRALIEQLLVDIPPPQ